jgi:hypothetical protein
VSRALLAVPIAIVLLAWGSGVLEKHYDADEVSQAHTIWLIAHGQVPYRDFFDATRPSSGTSTCPCSRCSRIDPSCSTACG